MLAFPSALVGLVVGLLGGGGAGLSVPLLVYLFGLAPKQAVATSLVVVGTSSATGAAFHALRRRVDFRLALVLAPVAAASAFAAGRVSHHVPDALILLMLAGLLTISGIAMLRGRRAEGTRPTGAPARLLVRGLALGASLGVITGLLGAGGGLLAIPALVLIGRLDLKTAVGTSLFVITLVSASALLGSGALREIEPGIALGAAAAAAIGASLGVLLARRVSAARLRRWMGAAALGMAALLVGGEIAGRLLA